MRLPRSLQWRIALAYTALIFVIMGAVSLYLVNFVRHTLISNLEERMELQTELLGDSVAQYLRGPIDGAGLREASERTGQVVDGRVTIIGLDGSVLADNGQGPGTLEDLTGRPEVQEALVADTGRDTRASEVTGEEMLYTALPIRVDGSLAGVARIAVSTSGVKSSINRIIATIAVSAIVVAVLSIALGWLVARRTSRSVRSVAQGARRLAEGDLEHRVKALSSDEAQELADAFNNMAATIRDMVRDLSTERNKLSAVLDTMTDGVVVLGPDGRVMLMNRAAQFLLDVKLKETAGSRLVEIVRDHELQTMVSRAMASRDLLQVEVELLHRRRFLSAIATPLGKDPSDGVLLTLHDLTRLRQVETTRKEFVSNVSHELRSPLASVKAMVETLEDGALDERDLTRDFLQRIHRDVDRMDHIVNDLLELSRLESGQVPLHLSPLDLRGLIEEVAARFGSQAQSKDIAVDLELPDALPLVIGQKEKLRRVLVNLLENAVKFTPTQGRVTLAGEAQDRFVQVHVKDTGIGIPREHLPHVFERFYKVDRARRDNGTGLGLAIVKHIVQAHGGQVTVESREGEGSAFSFTVPRAD